MSALPRNSQGRTARVAFLSLDDSSQPNLLSGGFHGMREGFRQIGCDVIDVFPVRPRPRPGWVARKVYHRLRGRFHHWDREPEFLLEASRIAAERIRAARPDFVIAVQSQACTYLKVDAPLVLTHDQPFIDLQAYFPFEPRPRTRDYVQAAIAQEGEAFEAADLIAFPSVQACRTVERIYGVRPEKLLMVPWGGNLPHPPSADEARRMVEARRSGPIVLTAIGVHWQRKGGDVVVEAYRHLKAQGFDVQLNVTGMSPPGPVGEGVTVFPFLNKSVPDEMRSFSELLTRTHFLVAPSRVEAFGHIFSEAAAFGVPAIASDVGGVPSSIEDGVNGKLLPLGATGADYARAIIACHTPFERYEALAHASRRRFEQDLNWPAFCRRIVDAVADLGTSRTEHRVDARRAGAAGARA